MSEQTTQPAPPPKLKTISLWLGAIIFAAVIATAAFVWIDKTELPQTSVATEWNATISRLGIDPIYPPQEDVSVGDVFVTITDDALGQSQSESLQGRAVKLWQIDLSKELKEAYKSIYVFPDTLPRPKNVDEIWGQKSADGSVFDVAVERRHMPLVVLPGFSVARVRQISTTGNWISKSLQAIGAIGADAQRTIELKIPFAETYGVSAIVANGHLVHFCSKFAPICSERTARGFLSSLVGAEAFQRVKTGNSEKPDETAYRLKVEIFIVSRVYMTRSIETVTYSSGSFGGQAKLALQLSESLSRLQTEAAAVKNKQEVSPSKPSPDTSSGGNARSTDEISELRRALEEQKARLAALVSDVAGAPPGGSVSIQSLDESRISVTQTLQRPVAIGFRSVRRQLTP